MREYGDAMWNVQWKHVRVLDEAFGGDL